MPKGYPLPSRIDPYTIDIAEGNAHYEVRCRLVAAGFPEEQHACHWCARLVNWSAYRGPGRFGDAVLIDAYVPGDPAADPFAPGRDYRLGRPRRAAYPPESWVITCATCIRFIWKGPQELKPTLREPRRPRALVGKRYQDAAGRWRLPAPKRAEAPTPAREDYFSRVKADFEARQRDKASGIS